MEHGAEEVFLGGRSGVGAGAARVVRGRVGTTGGVVPTGEPLPGVLAAELLVAAVLGNAVLLGLGGGTWVRGAIRGSLLAGREPGRTAGPLAPSRPSYTERTIGAAAWEPRPACSTMPTTTNLALLAGCPGWTGPHEANHDVSCLP